MEQVDAFRYLDSIVHTERGKEADVNSRTNKARAAFHTFINMHCDCR